MFLAKRDMLLVMIISVQIPAKRREHSEMSGVDFKSFKESQYDILAAGLREHLDMKKIYQILEEGI